MEEAKIDFSGRPIILLDTFIRCYGVTGMETYVRLHKAGFNASSSRVTSEKLLKTLLKGYLQNVKKMQVRSNGS